MSQTSPPAVPTICPKCNHQLEAVQADRSTHFVCPECSSYFVDAWDEDKEVLQSFANLSKLRPLIAPGTKGTIFAKKYQVAGCMFKSERADKSSRWMEYLLYGDGDASAVLVEFEGTWMLVRTADETPQKGRGDNLTYKRGTYTPYHQYQFDIINASGCFDYDVLEDQKLDVREYENGSHRLIFESENGTDGTWYQALPVDFEMLASAFRLPAYSFPGGSNKAGRKAADNPFRPQLSWLYRIAFVAVVVVALIQFGINYFHPSSELLNAEFVANADSLTTAGEKPVGTASFRVQSKSALSVDLEAPLANNWLEVSAVLVNDKTGKVYESAKSLEQYSGYEDGESWSEGSNSKEIVFSSVPPGNYHLNVTSTGDAASNTPNIPLKVRVMHQNWLLSNFIIVLLVIVAFPVIVKLRSNHYDQNN
jgi:hypothetical protein